MKYFAVDVQHVHDIFIEIAKAACASDFWNKINFENFGYSRVFNQINFLPNIVELLIFCDEKVLGCNQLTQKLYLTLKLVKTYAQTNKKKPFSPLIEFLYKRS